MARPERAKKKKESLLDSFKAQTHELGRQPIAKNQRKSLAWFKKRVHDAIRSRKVQRPHKGNMYVFAYDAKHKDKLPYWDKFPCIICLGVEKGYMLGLNLHYIPPKDREKFLTILLRYATTKTVSNTTRLSVDWGRVKNIKFSKHMVKLYILKRIKGSLEEVKPHDWYNVIHMPLQQFVAKNGRNISAVRAYDDRYRRR
ncbi:DNA end protector during packaging [Vibrio phage phi-ST2]|uniref:DNA end protector during packaging n=2 Tax=Schizotequatrovirus valkk3 TaxID=1914021 RepID=A0A126HGV6_9CAUD|nr:DNA end protector [Vibrio phage ValKK3]ALP47070.1 DNA end protector during packaging [Vibrio phage phi-Grn1]ALP47449.1 DNA end protector during packaging [Vibrio phage phi-ST2]QBX06143.1 DNA end protector protein [Vibrio phage Va3]QNJ54768.1 DNA end protector protein [Vibrio phage vB_ValM_R10Z]QNJ55155.1 DNA end protector protein [Vibrio phage vB_ValM_R11Z]URQ03532.1 DNA end protector protein [Vibrio phage PVA23]